MHLVIGSWLRSAAHDPISLFYQRGIPPPHTTAPRIKQIDRLSFIGEVLPG